jgi:hypothetical protein
MSCRVGWAKVDVVGYCQLNRQGEVWKVWVSSLIYKSRCNVSQT